MPDTKLTWDNLRTHFRKWAIIYAVVLGTALLIANLLWTTTTPQLPDERQVLICLAAARSDTAPLADLAGEMLERTQADFPEVASVEFESLPFLDSDYTGPILLMSRLSTGETDAFLADSSAMSALAQSDACLPLDGLVDAGWLSGCGLEPLYTTAVDPDTGKTTTALSALRLDRLHALMDRGAFDNQGAFLVVAANGRNIESTLHALSVMVEKLMLEGEAHD